MQQTELANAIAELANYKGLLTTQQLMQAAIAITQGQRTVERYIGGEAKKLATAIQLLNWLRANVILPGAAIQAA